MFKIKHITIFLVSLTLSGALQAMSYTQEERDAYSQYMKAQKALGQKPISMAQFIRQFQAAPLKEDVGELKRSLQEKESQLSDKQKDFEKQIKDLQTTIKNQESELAQLKKERDRRSTDLASAGEKLAQAQKQNEDRINAERADLQKRLDEQQRGFDKQMRDKQAEISAAERELADLQKTRAGTSDAFKKEREQLEKEKQQFDTKKAELEAQIAESEKAKQKAETDAITTKKELDELQSKLEQRQKTEVARLEKAAIQIQNKNEQIKKMQSELDTTKQEAGERIKQLEQQLEQKGQQLAKAKEEGFLIGPEAITGDVKLPEFHELIRSGELKEIQSFLEKNGKKALESKDKEGRTPLFIALAIGNSAIVKFLVEQGANVNAIDNSAHSLLQYVGDNIRHNVNILKTLKKQIDAAKSTTASRRLNLNYRGMEDTLLKNIELAKFLIKNKANPAYFDEGTYIYNTIKEVHPESAEDFKRVFPGNKK